MIERKKMEPSSLTEHVEHIFKPVYDVNSEVLILGTMPSPVSRKAGFYYSNKQNRFWPVLAEIFNQKIPETIEEKEQFLYRNHIALWDVLKACNIKGADDSSIKNPVVNDINSILLNTNIKAVFTNGNKASALYKKYCFPDTGISAYSLPSTSPANARYRFNDLVSSYKCILKYIGKCGDIHSE